MSNSSGSCQSLRADSVIIGTLTQSLRDAMNIPFAGPPPSEFDASREALSPCGPMPDTGSEKPLDARAFDSECEARAVPARGGRPAACPRMSWTRPAAGLKFATANESIAGLREFAHSRLLVHSTSTMTLQCMLHATRLRDGCGATWT